MRKHLLAILAAPLLLGAIAIPAHAATGTVKPGNFTTIGATVSNIKIESFDHGCLTYAHPVAGSQVGTAPCTGGHNWDWVTSSDGTQEVFKAHGTDLALADSGGHIVLEASNTTSDSLLLGNQVSDSDGTVFTVASFDEAPAIFVMDTGVTGNVVPSASLNVHDAWVAG